MFSILVHEKYNLKILNFIVHTLSIFFLIFLFSFLVCCTLNWKIISNYQGIPSLLMSRVKQTPRSQTHQQPQSPVLHQTAKAPQSHKICPLRNLTESKICLPWKWNKRSSHFNTSQARPSIFSL